MVFSRLCKFRFLLYFRWNGYKNYPAYVWCYFEHVPQGECLRRYLSATVIDCVASVSPDSKSQACSCV